MSTFKIRPIPLAAITTNGYQRDIDPLVVARIVARFDAAQWDLPKVAEVEGGYRVIAGQHRVEAARHFLADDQWPFETPQGYIDVQVIAGLGSVAEEADLFLSDAGNKKAIAPFFKHRAGLEACHQDSLDIEASLQRYAVNLVPRQRRMTGTTFVPIATLYTLYRQGNGKQVVDETLKLRSMWSKDDIFRSDGSIVGGLGIVARELLASDGDVRRLEQVVKRFPANKVAQFAIKLAMGGRGKGMSLSQPRTYAMVLRDLLGPAPTTPAQPPKVAFVSRFPVAVAAGALQV